MRQIAIYDKGGIGKSTTASNLSAALAGMNYKVMQVGCDPKQDSTTALLGKFQATVLDTLQENKVSFDVNFGSDGKHEQLIKQFVAEGFNNVLCVESGGPRPGVGCAGRGVLVALEFLCKHNVFDKYKIEIVIYDVLGDVVCGGVAAPMRKGFAGEVYLITSGELMSLYAANNIAKAIYNLAAERRNARVGGLILNARNVVGEIELIEEFAEKLGVPVMAHIPRSDHVQLAEFESKTVIEAFPHSEQAQIYRNLAHAIQKNEQRIIPTPFETIGDIQELLKRHQTIKHPTEKEAVHS